MKSEKIRNIFNRWEFYLFAIFILINIVNASLSSNYMNANNLFGAMQIFLDKGFVMLGMAFIIMSGQIDISVGSIIALSSVVMGVAYNNGVPMEIAVILCVVTATVCGMINGYLVTKFHEIPAMIFTLSTMIIFRGIASIMLEDKGAGNFPDWFSFLSWGNLFGIPFILIMFIIASIVLGILMQKTVFGRKVRALGSGAKAAKYSGIKTEKTLFLCYTLLGIMAGITALFLASKMGTTRPNMATGYEMDAIAMVVLGGFSTAGGKGTLLGAVIAIFIIGFMNYGLGIVNVPTQFMTILLGVLLLAADIISGSRKDSTSKPNKLKIKKENENV